ncbi:MAG: alpha/beta hydrolase [Candidatus Roizmanbacteria bacterium]
MIISIQNHGHFPSAIGGINKNIHYEVVGEGSPVLFVHGWGGSQKSLQPVADILSSEYRCYTLDLPGFGESDNPDPDWSVKEYAECVVAFIHQLDLPTVSYIGHSFGGSLGIYIASHYPEIVTKLVLCDASYKRKAVRKRGGDICSKLPSQPLQEVCKFSRRIAYRLLYPHSDLYKFPHLESNFRKIVTDDLTTQIDLITTPTLILWGEIDVDTPVSFAHELHEHIKGSFLKIVPQVGHGLPIKMPQLVVEEIQKFFKIK